MVFDFLRRPTQAEEVGYPNVAPEGAFTYQDPLQGAGFLDRMKYYQQNNPEVLMNFAAGMFAGDTGGALSHAGNAMLDARREEQKKQAQAAQQNSTLQYLIAKGVDPTEAKAAMNDPVILKHLLQMAEDAANPETKGHGAYGTPIPMVNDKLGKYDIGAMSTADGSLLLGGKPAGPDWRPATIFEQAQGRALGAGIGGQGSDALGTYYKISTATPILRRKLTELTGYSKDATFTYFDQAWDNVARQFKQTTEGAKARAQFESLVNLTILPTLTQTLGAQFTQVDRESLTATLGQPNMSPAEKIAVIDVFLDDKMKEAEAAAALAQKYDVNRGSFGGIPESGAPAVGGGGGGSIPTYNQDTGNFE